MLHLTYNDLRDNSDWQIIPETEGSDYSGSSVTRANYEWFLDNHSKDDDLAEVTGWFCGYGIAIKSDSQDPDLREIIDALSEYPVICEDTWARVEARWISEALDSGILSDFVREVERITDHEDIFDEISQDLALEIFEASRVISGEEWRFEHAGAFIDVSRVAQFALQVIADRPIFAARA